MGFNFGSGGQPSERARGHSGEDKYPELTTVILALKPSNGRPHDGWEYIEYPTTADEQADTRKQDRMVSAVRSRITTNWGQQFKAMIRPRPEDGSVGMMRIWFRIVRK